MTETVAAPLTVSEAAHAQVETLGRVRMHQSAYARLRGRLDITATIRARADWGMAVLEFVDASVALAEAKDRGTLSGRQRPPRSACSPPRHLSAQAWARYQEIRRTGNIIAIEAAQDVWRIEFVGWFEKVNARLAIEDEAAFQELRAQLDESGRLGAASGADDPEGLRRAHLVHTAQERERQEAIRRDQTRNEPAADLGWRPAR